MPDTPAPRRSLRSAILLLAPGAMVAATGVGAGDLSTAGFAGSQLGMAVLWAVVLGAMLKFVINEGLARWQLATGETILDGAVRILGWPVIVVFALYLVPWTVFVSGALLGACVTITRTIFPDIPDDAGMTLLLGIGYSGAAASLVWIGGFAAFERVMGVCIAVMFASVIVCAALLRPDLGEVVSGLTVPRIPDLQGEGLSWTIGLMGGVGGTLTVLCYGYWIQEAGRSGTGWLRGCRIDLGVGYLLTGLFGCGMIVIAEALPVQDKGAALFGALGDRVGEALGGWGRGLFLAGAWAAIFSSVLGVWQAVPYIIADFITAARQRIAGKVRPAGEKIDTQGVLYRWALVALAVLPLPALMFEFKDVQKYYTVIGAGFIPMLALVLLLLNTRRHIGAARNGPLTIAGLVAAVAFFGWASWYEIAKALGL